MANQSTTIACMKTAQPTSFGGTRAPSSLRIQPKHRTAKGRARRKALLEAAAEIFARKGYHSTTISEIVRTQKVSKGIFYWYFSSKEELFGEILREAISGLRRAQAAAIEGIDDPLERIAAAIEASLAYIRLNMPMFAVFEEALGTETFGRIVKQGHKKLIGDTVAQLEEGMRRGTVRRGDAEMMAHAIFGTMSYVARFILPFSPQPDHAIAETVRFCVAGISSKPKER